MKKKIKTAVIGVGNMGKNHVRAYSEISELVAVSDVFINEGKQIAGKYKVKFYQNYEEMLDKEKPDAVSVVVPTKFHKEVAINCLKRKIPTLVEKPIADSILNAKEMINEAKKNQTLLMVGHIERFNPAVEKLKDLIEKDRFGNIISLLTIRVGINPPKTDLSDVSIDLAVHDVDIFNYLLNEFPYEKRVLKNKIFKQNIADSASILLRYRNATGIIQTNWITPIKMRKLYLTGTDGFAELDYISQKLVLYDKIINKKLDGDFFELVSLSETPKKEIYISRKEPLKQELLHFIKIIGKKQKLNPEYAYQALRIVLEKDKDFKL